MSKLPALQWYVGDWRKDVGVQSLSYHDRGVWFEMLMLMHESERRGVLVLNGQAMEEDVIARLLGLNKQTLTKTVARLLAAGVADREPETGALLSRRMVRDERIRQVRTQAGKQGGNPVLLNHKPNQTPNHPPKQNPTPSSSSSVSASTQPPSGGRAAPSPSPGANGEFMLAQELGREIKLAMRAGDIALVAQVIANETPEHGDGLKAKDFIRDRALEARSRGEPVTVFWLQDRKFDAVQAKDKYQIFLESDV